MFKLSKEQDRIYFLHFENGYDCAMAFLRYQEYYESPNPRFYRNKFTISSYIDWYVKSKGSFSYYEDWSGFNLPIEIIDIVHSIGIPDPNHYDLLMKGIVEMIKSNADSDKCYLIGASGDNNSNAYAHEMAHGLYYVDERYRDGVIKLYTELPTEMQETFKVNLIKKG